MSELYKKYLAKAIANTELDAEHAFKLGKAVAFVLSQNLHMNARILVAKDTRASGDMIEAAFSAGVCSIGGNCVSIGIMPVCALTYLVYKYKMDAAVMIGASDDDARYNGIRVFDSCGKLLNDEQYKAIDDYAAGRIDFPEPTMAVGRIRRTHTGLRDYVDYIKSSFGVDLSGIKIAIDSANGAAFESAKLIFSELGADVEVINNRPDGLNINQNCGMLCPDSIQKYALSHKCSVGIVFSGDVSDFAAVDKQGKLIDISAFDDDDAIVNALHLVCSQLN